MTRVLQLVTRDEPGGVQVLADMVAAGLSERGHTVDTMALAGPGQSPLAVIRRIAAGSYEAILSYQVAAGLLGSLFGTLSGVPLRAVHLTAIPSAMRPLWRWLDRQCGSAGLHTTIVANSRATADSMACYPKAYRRRLTVLPHGVLPLPMPAPLVWREQLGLPAVAALLVASGRLAPQKDHATAVAALARLPTAHLAIAGDGELGGDLLAAADRAGVASRLHLLGNLDRARLAGLLSAADLYLFPSRWESFGLAGVEAAMLGVPIIASDLLVLREVLAFAADAGMVRFHGAGDSAALARQVQAMLVAYPSTAQRQLSASAMLEAHAVDRMIDLYCRLLETGRT